jgi:hypothetical protein
VTPEPSSDACLEAQRSLLRAPLRVGCAGTCLGGYAPCLIEEARGRLQCQGGGSSLQGVSPTPASRADVYSVTANAARHARSDGAPVTLTVYADDRTMRVEVGDGGPGFEPELLRPPDTDRSGGWGIPMVAAPIGGCRKGKANDGVVRDRPPGPRDAGRSSASEPLWPLLRRPALVRVRRVGGVRRRASASRSCSRPRRNRSKRDSRVLCGWENGTVSWYPCLGRTSISAAGRDCAWP